MACLMQVGYAVTVAKFQGQTLEHEAATHRDANAPVAMSRVRELEELFWYGRPTREFFKPAQDLKFLWGQRFVPGMTPTPKRVVVPRNTPSLARVSQSAPGAGTLHDTDKTDDTKHITSLWPTRLNLTNQASGSMKTGTPVSLCFSVNAICSARLLLCICRFQCFCSQLGIPCVVYVGTSISSVPVHLYVQIISAIVLL